MSQGRRGGYPGYPGQPPTGAGAPPGTGFGAFPDQPPSYHEATTTGVWGAPPTAPPPPASQLYQQPQPYPQPYPQQSQPFPQPYPQQPPQQAYMPPSPDDELCVWFHAVDEDGNGHITAQELQQALLDENFKPFSIRTCRTLVNMFDDNANGEIELSEFVQLYHYVRKWRDIFLNHDADKSGTIELDELLDSLNTVHAPLRFSRSFCEQMLRRFGKRSGGQHCLSLDQFIALNAGLSRLASGFSGRPGDIESFLLKRLRDT